MDPRFSVFNVTTAVLLGLTLWVLIARIRGVVESNWPLYYYAGVIGYSVVFPGYLDEAWIYAGVVCALLLRFEFMGGWFLKIIRTIDILVLLVIAYWAFDSMVLY